MEEELEAAKAEARIEGPGTIGYTFTAPDSGTYFLRCDLHPTQMTGTVMVG